MKLNYDQALALGLDELKRREEAMRDDIDRDQGEYNVIKNAIAHLESVEQKEAEQQERLATNEEMKEAFELPKDYSELFNDNRANDEIKLLIGQVIDQMRDQYEFIILEKDEENLNAIRDLREKYEETISAAQRDRDESNKAKEQAEAETQDLRNVVKQLNEEKAKLSEDLSAVKSQLAQATLEKQDAETKRDAAMREVESLKAQIVELEQITNRPKPSAGFKFNLTSGIEDKPIKTAKELALERFGLLPPKTGGEPSGASFPDQAEDRVTDELADAAGTQPDTTDQVSEEDFRDSLSDMERGSSLVQDATAREGSVGNNEEVSAAAIEARFKAIEERLSAIERHPNIRMSA